jgi:hypothetical protein
MSREFFRSLLLLVNDKDSLSLVQRYAESRTDSLRTQLETAKDIDRVKELQGAISELRRFRTLREEVIKGAE